MLYDVKERQHVVWLTVLGHKGHRHLHRLQFCFRYSTTTPKLQVKNARMYTWDWKTHIDRTVCNIPAIICVSHMHKILYSLDWFSTTPSHLSEAMSSCKLTLTLSCNIACQMIRDRAFISWSNGSLFLMVQIKNKSPLIFVWPRICDRPMSEQKKP